jgi:hypothetical protein
MSRLIGVEFIRCFVVRSLEMQLLLWYILANWLGVFCMMRAIFRGGVISWGRFRDLLSVPNMKRKISCIVRKGEKQIQILDGY